MSNPEPSIVIEDSEAPELQSSSQDVVKKPRKPINIAQIKKKEAKRKNAERAALARKNETPEKRELRLAKRRKCSAARRQLDKEKNRKRKREKDRKAGIEERGAKKKVLRHCQENRDLVRDEPKSTKLLPKKAKVQKTQSKKSQVDQVLNKDPLPKSIPIKVVHLNMNPRSENVVPHSPPIIDPERIRANLERLQRDILEREKMRLVLRAQLTAIYQNFCVSQQNLIDSIKMTIIGIQISLIHEEIPNFFDVLIPGFLIRKMKYTISTIERITIHGTTFVSHQFYSFFKFMFDQMESGTTIAQVIVDPRLIEVFSIRFPSENFERLWRRIMEEAVSHHFDVIHIFDPINRIVIPIYKKKQRLPTETVK